MKSEVCLFTLSTSNTYSQPEKLERLAVQAELKAKLLIKKPVGTAGQSDGGFVLEEEMGLSHTHTTFV